MHKGKVIQNATHYIQDVIVSVKGNMLTYTDLDNPASRRSAFDVIEKIQKQEKYLIEPISIDKANKIIEDLEFNLNPLNDTIGQDKVKRDTSLYYN